MVKSILTASGLPFRRSNFRKPPAGAYAVFFDNVTVSGPDRIAPSAAAGLPRVYAHDAIVEIYAPDASTIKAAEAAFEASIDAQGIPWNKQDRIWIRSEQIYETVYDFSFTEKRRT